MCGMVGWSRGVNFIHIRDAGDPVELAKFYSDARADEIVFLDITATSENRDTVADVVERTAAQVFVPLTVGGGIRTLEDFQLLLRAGADKISVNSAAVTDPTLITRAAERFGSQCVVLAIDARRRTDGSYEVVTAGGRPVAITRELTSAQLALNIRNVVMVRQNPSLETGHRRATTAGWPFCEAKMMASLF